MLEYVPVSDGINQLGYYLEREWRADAQQPVRAAALSGQPHPRRQAQARLVHLHSISSFIYSARAR